MRIRDGLPGCCVSGLVSWGRLWKERIIIHPHCGSPQAQSEYQNDRAPKLPKQQGH